MADASVPVLVDFLSNVPIPLTAVLVRLAPCIARLRRALEAVSWQQSWYDSWLIVGFWWAVCLLAEASVRYLTPIILLCTLAAIKWSSRPHTAPPPTTEHTLQTTITDLTIIQSLIPTVTVLPVAPLSLLFRVSVILYIPYLLLTHFVPLPILFGAAGTLILTWRAPWAAVLRSTLWRSAWIRWSVYYTWARISGQPLPPRVLSFQPTPTTPKPVDSLRFLFTLYENQRWWMGLDWTAALLPGERPSWCSASQHAVSPPNAFALPDETTVYLRKASGGRVKRTATWRWEEPEWRVLVRQAGGGVTRVERSMPTAKDESLGGGRLPKTVSKMSESGSTVLEHGNGTDGTDEPVSDTEDSIATDADGWVYRDNKWEGPGSKGGMGKYTRHRRWTRVAVVNETVDEVEDGDVGMERPAPVPDEPEDASDSQLKQRLRRALSKSVS